MKSVTRTERIRYIEISVGRTFVDDNGEDATDSGTHLLVFPYENTCDDLSFAFNPAIINYYRQFFMRLDEKVINVKEGFHIVLEHPPILRSSYCQSMALKKYVTYFVFFIPYFVYLKTKKRIS